MDRQDDYDTQGDCMFLDMDTFWGRLEWDEWCWGKKLHTSKKIVTYVQYRLLHNFIAKAIKEAFHNLFPYEELNLMTTFLIDRVEVDFNVA